MKVIVNIKNQGITETHRIMIGKDAYRDLQFEKK